MKPNLIYYRIWRGVVVAAVTSACLFLSRVPADAALLVPEVDGGVTANNADMTASEQMQAGLEARWLGVRERFAGLWGFDSAPIQHGMIWTQPWHSEVPPGVTRLMDPPMLVPEASTWLAVAAFCLLSTIGLIRRVRLR